MQNGSKLTPRGNKILVRADFEVSALNVLNEDIIKTLTPKRYVVVNKSVDIKDLNIGDEVKLNPHTIPIIVDIPGNNQSLKAKQEIHKNGKAIVGVGTVKFSEYIIVDDFDVIGKWNKEEVLN